VRCSGLLIGPTTTMFYDSGFLIGLKGFVAAIFGGLASYPQRRFGAIFVGCSNPSARSGPANSRR
jgi:branched-chain amino acid transport system permease protein